MGLFSGFLERRRKRESAIPEGFEPAASTPPPAEVKPVGQPLQGPGTPQLGSLGVGDAMDLGSVVGVLGMIKQAYQSGNIQISHGESQVIDLRGTADGQALREQIIAAMQQAGIDPEAMEGAQVASQYSGLQQNILEVLSQHGVDVTQGASFEVLPDLDGDGKPG